MNDKTPETLTMNNPLEEIKSPREDTKVNLIK